MDIDDVRLADAQDPVLKDCFRMHPCVRPAFRALLDDAADEALVLKVLRAWDDSDGGNLDDLHGEGRALNLAVENGSPDDVTLLSQLAQRAGFHWVEHAGEHIHVSVRPYEHPQGSNL